MKKTLLIFLLLFLFSIAFVEGAFKIYQIAPNQFQTLNTTSVNFSIRINNTNDGNKTFNAVIYNRSSSSNNYSTLFTETINNNTFWNRTYILQDDTRYWWFANITNVSNSSSVITTLSSNVRIIDIDVGDIFNLGIGIEGRANTINFSLLQGDIVVAGTVTAGVSVVSPIVTVSSTLSAPLFSATTINTKSINSTNATSSFFRLINTTTTGFVGCSFNLPAYGQIRLNSSSGQFLGCNGSVWSRLN